MPNQSHSHLAFKQIFSWHILSLCAFLQYFSSQERDYLMGLFNHPNELLVQYLKAVVYLLSLTMDAYKLINNICLPKLERFNLNLVLFLIGLYFHHFFIFLVIWVTFVARKAFTLKFLLFFIIFEFWLLALSFFMLESLHLHHVLFSLILFILNKIQLYFFD